MGGTLLRPHIMFDSGSATKMHQEVTEPLEHFGTGRILF